MNITHIYDKFNLIENNLITYGFEKINDTYVINKNIMNDTMYVTFKIKTNLINVDVYDSFDNELYLPFNIANVKGKFVNDVKDEVAIHLNDILKNCFQEVDVKQKLNEYIENKYNIKPTYIFEKERYAYKINNKWFGFVMKVKYQYLGLEKEGTIDILNVKLDENEIKEIIDNKYFFKAYHMNKKYWLTIMLSASTPFEKIIEFIDKSYQIINKRCLE